VDDTYGGHNISSLVINVPYCSCWPCRTVRLAPQLLAICWRTLAAQSSWGDIPNGLRGIRAALRLDYTRAPPGQPPRICTPAADSTLSPLCRTAMSREGANYLM
jgi:hypothetical protein